VAAPKKGRCKRWSKTGKRRCLKRLKGRSSRRARSRYRRAGTRKRRGRRCKHMGINRLGRPSCKMYYGTSKRSRARYKLSTHGPVMPPGFVPVAGTGGLSGYRRRYR